MIKTVFYKPCDKEEADYWFDQNPYKMWFELDNILYDVNRNVVKNTLVPEDNKKCIKPIIISYTVDNFLDFGIIRRIGLSILKY
jgi:hypothetical protein